MPSVVSHAAVAVAAGLTFAPRNVPAHFWSLSVICSIIPDADGIGFFFGIPYEHFFGHRGFFHSPFFGLLVGIFVVTIFFRELEILSRQWFFYLIFFSLLSASHGILDAFTNGGLGIPLFTPFRKTRYFAPWRPIMVSPIGIKAFFSRWGLLVIQSEFLWLWMPCLILVMISKVLKKVGP